MNKRITEYLFPKAALPTLASECLVLKHRLGSKAGHAFPGSVIQRLCELGQVALPLTFCCLTYKNGGNDISLMR